MFFTYLRRELRGRRKQTLVVAIGMALAITLVIVVNAFASGVKDAQSSVLESVYGVGTDITVTQTGQPGERGGPGSFDFGADEGAATDDGSRRVSQDRLSVSPGTASLDATALTKITAIDHVNAASATLKLTNTHVDGEMPDFDQMREQMQQQGGPGGTGEQGTPPSGADGAGGSAFSIDSVTVTGIDPAASAVGPLTTVEISEGRGLKTSDAEADVAVLDATYAAGAEIAVGDTITIGSEDMLVVGLVASTTGDDVATGSDVYIPLKVAQTLAGLENQVTSVYVRADSGSHVDSIATAIGKALPDASVSTQADLASEVTGSLSTASKLVSTLGTWLSAIVLAAAFGLAILFTVSGVNRRTRELGTLKAIGWPSRRVVGQVAGESVVQGLLGGVIGLVLGVLAVLGLNAAGITLSGASGATSFAGPGGGAGGPMETAGQTGGGPMMGGPGGVSNAVASAVDVTLHAPVNVTVIAIAVGLAVLGGLLAGVIGGRRVARLRPAEALRSVG